MKTAIAVIGGLLVLAGLALIVDSLASIKNLLMGHIDTVIRLQFRTITTMVACTVTLTGAILIAASLIRRSD